MEPNFMAGAAASASQSLLKLGMDMLQILLAILAVGRCVCSDCVNSLEAGEVASLEIFPG